MCACLPLALSRLRALQRNQAQWCVSACVRREGGSWKGTRSHYVSGELQQVLSMEFWESSPSPRGAVLNRDTGNPAGLSAPHARRDRRLARAAQGSASLPFPTDTHTSPDIKLHHRSNVLPVTHSRARPNRGERRVRHGRLTHPCCRTQTGEGDV